MVAHQVEILPRFRITHPSRGPAGYAKAKEKARAERLAKDGRWMKSSEQFQHVSTVLVTDSLV